MRDKLEKLIAAYEELEKKLSDPSVVADQKEYMRLAKEHAHQAQLVAAAREYLGALDDIEAAKEMQRETSDADEKAMLQEDIAANEAKLPQLEEDIKFMLIPGDPNDEKNTIVEIRSLPAATRRLFLRVTSSRCTSVSASRRAGSSRCSIRARATRAALSRSSSRFRAIRSTPS